MASPEGAGPSPTSASVQPKAQAPEYFWFVFLEMEVDDPSNFFQQLSIEVVQEDRRFIIKVKRCAPVAHVIAAIALEMSRASKPPGLHFGWSEMNLLSASWSYLAFGEGNIPWKVRELILRAEPDPAKRPRVIVG